MKLAFTSRNFASSASLSSFAINSSESGAIGCSESTAAK